MKKYMTDAQVKCINNLALRQWHVENEDKTLQRQQMLKLQRKLNLCSRDITLRDGKKVRTRCRTALCPHCSREYSLAQKLRFVKNFKSSDRNGFRFMTVVIGLTYDIERVYPMFDAFRIKLRKDISNRRNRKDDTASLWKRVGLEGSMELDSFMSEDFQFLGSEKKRQYEKLCGYVPPESGNVPVFVVTGHFTIYKGRLSLKTFSELIEKHAKYVHFEKLWKDQDISEAIGNCLGYSAKVNYKTTLENCNVKLWTMEQIQALSGLISRSRGRCSWKFSVKVRK